MNLLVTPGGDGQELKIARMRLVFIGVFGIVFSLCTSWALAIDLPLTKGQALEAARYGRTRAYTQVVAAKEYHFDAPASRYGGFAPEIEIITPWFNVASAAARANVCEGSGAFPRYLRAICTPAAATNVSAVIENTVGQRTFYIDVNAHGKPVCGDVPLDPAGYVWKKENTDVFISLKQSGKEIRPRDGFVARSPSFRKTNNDCAIPERLIDAQFSSDDLDIHQPFTVVVSGFAAAGGKGVYEVQIEPSSIR